MRPMRWLGVGLVLVVLTGVALVSRPVDGPIVRTVALAVPPRDVVVDGRTGLAFIINGNANFGFSSAPRNGVPFGPGGGAPFGPGRNVSVLDLRTGAILRTVQVGPDPRQIAVDERSGRVFVTNDDDATVSVLDAGSGAGLGAINVGARPHALSVDPRAHHAFVLNTEAGSISVLDTSSGKVLHTFTLSENASLDAAPVVATADRVVLGDGSAVQVLDAHSGVLLHTIQVSQVVNHLALDARTGLIFVTGDQGVSVVNPRSGRVQTLNVGGSPSAVAVDARRGRAFVLQPGAVSGTGTTTAPGTLTVLDARTGTALKTINVGVSPNALAVDEQTGRVVVVNTGGQADVSGAWGWLPSWLRRWLPFLNQSSTRAVPGSVMVIDPAR